MNFSIKFFAAKMFYAAYGSNLNKSQMEARCPKSKAIGSKVLKNWKLCFRGVADIVPDPGASVMLGIYLISEDCEKALDFYEDYPILYRKEYLQLKDCDEPIFTYVMNPGYGIGPPSKLYFEAILNGYADWKLPIVNLFKAGQQSLLLGNQKYYKSKRWKGGNIITQEFLDRKSD